MFPPHVDSLATALDYLSTWCDIVGGEQLDGIEWEELRDDRGDVVAVLVLPFRIQFAVGTVLTASMVIDPSLSSRITGSTSAPPKIGT